MTVSKLFDNDATFVLVYNQNILCTKIIVALWMNKIATPITD